MYPIYKPHGGLYPSFDLGYHLKLFIYKISLPKSGYHFKQMLLPPWGLAKYMPIYIGKVFLTLSLNVTNIPSTSRIYTFQKTYQEFQKNNF
jgi:hypothetical protein